MSSAVRVRGNIADFDINNDGVVNNADLTLPGLYARRAWRAEIQPGVAEGLSLLGIQFPNCSRMTGNPDRTGLETTSVGFWKESLPSP
jgi:hypothetical protein